MRTTFGGVKRMLYRLQFTTTPTYLNSYWSEYEDYNLLTNTISLLIPLIKTLHILQQYEDLTFWGLACFTESNSQIPFGRVILPLSHYFDGLLPKKSVSEWRMLYPPYKFNESPDFFRTGYENINDYAMPRPKDPIGFVKVDVNVNLNRSMSECLTMKRYISMDSSEVKVSEQSTILCPFTFMNCISC